MRIHNCFYLPENAADFDFSEYDYVVDAVDTVTAKIELIMRAKEAGTPVISSMGAGNKLDASAFRWRISIRRGCVRWRRLCVES